MYFVLEGGASLRINTLVEEGPALTAWEVFKDSIAHNLTHPLALLLVQIMTIMIVARVFSWLFRKIGQPAVIGEIIAGIVLGPSLVGAQLPEFSSFLFPTASLPNLQVISQIGLILFMFVVGMELDLKILKKKAHDAVVISHASIIFPFAMGTGLAYFTYLKFAPAGVPFLSYGLFLGIAMSITAFPVLARIVQERGLSRTRLGSMVITCAAADDITAWCLLAAVIAIAKAGSAASALYVLLMAISYVLVMLLFVRPFLNRIGTLYNNRESLTKPVVAIFFLTLLLSAWLSEIIGIHALFGAFLAGVIMPPQLNFRNIFVEKVEDLALVVLLPLFFVFTGLRTQIGLLNEPDLWYTCVAVIGVAVVGKFFGSAFAAKWVGQSWRDSLIIGSLMNTRGLMELVVLNIGYDLGILSPEIFAMMVLMALSTTFMTGPAISLIDWLLPEKIVVDGDSAKRWLMAFANPMRGQQMLRIAALFLPKQSNTPLLTALHLTPSTVANTLNVTQYEKNSFAPIREASRQTGLQVDTYFGVSSDPIHDILEKADPEQFDLLMVGIGQSIYSGSTLGQIFGFAREVLVAGAKRRLPEVQANPIDERTRQFIKESRIPVLISVIHQTKEIRKTVVILEDAPKNTFLERITRNLLQLQKSSCTVCFNSQNEKLALSLEKDYPHQLTLSSKSVRSMLEEKPDLVVLPYPLWEKLREEHPELLSEEIQFLLIRS